MDLKEIRVNPKNPRIIKDEKFEKLCRSISEFPKMLELRPIIVDGTGLILGGNMRFRAIQELKMDLKPEWFKVAGELTAEEQRRFVIEDNVSFGEWDWDVVANEYGKEEIETWGIDIFNNWETDYQGKNTEVDTDKLEESLDLECPKCHFKFKQNV